MIRKFQKIHPKLFTDPRKLGHRARIIVARNLAVMGQDSNSAAQALIGVMSSDPNSAVRSAATVALGSIALPSTDPIQALIQALNSDSSPEVRLAAVMGLEVIGVDSESTLEALQTQEPTTQSLEFDGSPKLSTTVSPLYDSLFEAELWPSERILTLFYTFDLVDTVL